MTQEEKEKLITGVIRLDDSNKSFILNGLLGSLSRNDEFMYALQNYYEIVERNK